VTKWVGLDGPVRQLILAQPAKQAKGASIHSLVFFFKLKIIEKMKFSMLYFCKDVNIQYYYNLNH